MLSCKLISGPLWLGIYIFLWWFLLAFFWLFVLHWRYELPCQDKLPEFHYTPILGCIRVLWLVIQPLGLGLDKALFGWNSAKMLQGLLLEIYELHDCVFILQMGYDKPHILKMECAKNGVDQSWILKFDNVEDWRTNMSGFDLIVSTRIHGCMAGISAGTPCFVIPTDFQIQVLVNAMQIPTVSMEKLCVGEHGCRV